MKKSRKPPLGPTPRFVYEENRIMELQDAIYRFIKANYPIPMFIIKEYNELTNRLKIED